MFQITVEVGEKGQVQEKGELQSKRRTAREKPEKACSSHVLEELIRGQ